MSRYSSFPHKLYYSLHTAHVFFHEILIIFHSLWRQKSQYNGFYLFCFFLSPKYKMIWQKICDSSESICNQNLMELQEIRGEWFCGLVSSHDSIFRYEKSIISWFSITIVGSLSIEAENLGFFHFSHSIEIRRRLFERILSFSCFLAMSRVKICPFQKNLGLSFICRAHSM